ncbi:MAG: CPBP family intramembrane metalloprotease [Synechococcus sp. SB0668_bin_15]|nr:CPBP family intramembrane metalloprotease [Synechococcus sp. SB0668_bin_15]MYC49118.1 CPBP family intramembrane metalloprotease [Synechococcus sp. SB0662_bin_14]MYG47077.1 CPBP family intramembrane metalloprotease [Synechococcus sp. SB0675_bin_6]MYK91631.1 CPBP family intramembrane metalloprotease [Synechococcus sp. SB0669_bin_8]
MNQTPHPRRLKWTEDAQKLLLALSLVLTVFVFWGPSLLGSLERPSVQGVLEQRQLELQALASRAVGRGTVTLSPGENAPLLSRQLFGADALRQLAAVLQERQDNPATPDRDLRLRQVLVLLAMNQPEQARLLLESLPPVTGQGEQSAAVVLQQALLQRAAGTPTTTAPLANLAPEALEDALPRHPLYPSLACSVLELDHPFCRGSHVGAITRLVLVGLVGPLAALVGILLWLVQLARWLWSRNRPQPPSPQPMAAPLTLPALMLFFFGGVVVLGNGGGILALSALRPWIQQAGSTGQAMATVLVYGSQALPGLAVLHWLRRSEDQSGWQWLQWGLGWRALPMALGTLLLTLPLVLLTSWGVSRLFPHAGGSNPLLDLVLNSRDLTALIFFALTACVLAPLYEELVFRATVLPTMARSYGAVVGVLLSSLLFAAAHLSLVEFLPLLILGLGLGWLRLRGGRLSACVLMHATWNGYTLANLALLSL